MSGFSQLALPPLVAQGVLQGDRNAIAEAYRVLAQAVVNMAARILNDRSLAEEVVQDTFVELVEKATSIRSIEAIPAWVRRVAVNHCLMRLRSPWHARRVAADAQQIIESQQDESSLDWVAGITSIEQALGALNEDTRLVIWLHDVEGYTHKEIAEFMGKTASFSKSQLARGYEKLLVWRQLQESRGIAPGTAITAENEIEHEDTKTGIRAPCAT